MCGRVTQKQEALEHEFGWNLANLQSHQKQYNIGIGETALVIDHSGELRNIKFGFHRSGRFNFNARAEGYYNKANQKGYNGQLGIHTNPIYAQSFTNNRCLIPVTSFIEGPEKERLSKPFKVSLNYTQAFMLAGIIGKDEKTGVEGFSIITCWPNQVIAELIQHHRSPVIIENPNTFEHWLNPESDLTEILAYLKPIADEHLDITSLNPLYKSVRYDEPYV